MTILPTSAALIDRGCRWRVVGGRTLDHRAWYDERVIFDSRSGETHLLNETAAMALDFLAQSPLTSAELTARIADWFGVEASNDLDRQIAELIQQLDNIGLIGPLPA